MTDTFNRAMLIGHWYRSEINAQGHQVTENAELCIDGSYEFTFCEQKLNGDVIEQITEVGDWGLVGEIHFTVTHGEIVDDNQYASDMTNEDNYHAYKVVTLNNQIFKYQHVVSKEEFILKRVIDKIAHC